MKLTFDFLFGVGGFGCLHFVNVAVARSALGLISLILKRRPSSFFGLALLLEWRHRLRVWNPYPEMGCGDVGRHVLSEQQRQAVGSIIGGFPAWGLGFDGPTNADDEDCMKLGIHPCTIYLFPSPRRPSGVLVSIICKSGARSRGRMAGGFKALGVTALQYKKSRFLYCY